MISCLLATDSPSRFTDTAASGAPCSGFAHYYSVLPPSTVAPSPIAMGGKELLPPVDFSDPAG